jgi:hypothetical protein
MTWHAEGGVPKLEREGRWLKVKDDWTVQDDDQCGNDPI